MEKPHASDPISAQGVKAPEVQTGCRKRRMIVRAMRLVLRSRLVYRFTYYPTATRRLRA